MTARPGPREPAPRALAGLAGMEARPGLGIYDFTHWGRARRASIAILDIVSGKWLASLTSAEESSTQVEACFLAALEAQDLLEALTSGPLPRCARRSKAASATRWPAWPAGPTPT